MEYEKLKDKSYLMTMQQRHTQIPALEFSSIKKKYRPNEVNQSQNYSKSPYSFNNNPPIFVETCDYSNFAPLSTLGNKSTAF